MCVKLKGLDAETFRKHLLEKHGVGVIAEGERDIRIAFSSVDVGQLEDLYAVFATGRGSCRSRKRLGSKRADRLTWRPSNRIPARALRSPLHGKPTRGIISERSDSSHVAPDC